MFDWIRNLIGTKGEALSLPSSASADVYAALVRASSLDVATSAGGHLIAANAHDATMYMFQMRGTLCHSFSRAEQELQALAQYAVGDRFDPAMWQQLPSIVRSTAALAMAEALAAKGSIVCAYGDELLGHVLAYCTRPVKTRTWKKPEARNLAEEVSALSDAALHYMNSAYLRMRPQAYLSWYSTAPLEVRQRFPRSVRGGTQ